MRYGWNLDPERWHDLERTISKYKWTRAYLERDFATSVPEESGIYVICASTSNIVANNNRLLKQAYNAIYAGQSTNLRRRFGSHVRGYGEVKRAKNTFGQLDFWFSTIEKPFLSDVEQLFIDTFGPPANEKNVKVHIGNPIPAGRILRENK
ncbi:MAG: GIY-YIG nuclease family protein [Gammaproteobacteria bacterium]|nr:GIY-YIG nuclease family protein [Gammaproteobacteria bacterium]